MLKHFAPALLFTLAHSIAVSSFAQPAFDVVEASINEIQSALERGQVTSVEIVDAYLQRIEAYDKQGPALNSIMRVNPQARQQAAALDAERSAGRVRGPLHGVPILVKDNYNTSSIPTTNGTVALAGFLPNANATQVELLLDAGAIVLAKTTLHEYARGITTVSSLSGQTRNPYDIRRVPGGSSGGTGAAVAASFAAIGLGSDTCGSIRIPSAFNNLFGLRPTKGLSSIHGVIPLSHTQDVAGPLARSLDDLAILLDVVVGYDPSDSATAVMQSNPHPQFRQNLTSVKVSGLRLGKLTSAFERSSAAVADPINAALEWYEENGARLIEVEIPELAELLSASALIGHEFRPDLEQYLAQFGSIAITDLADIVDNGLYHYSLNQGMTRSLETETDEEAYAAALAARSEVLAAIEQVFLDHELDAIVYPTVTETIAFTGEPQSGSQCQLSAHSGVPALAMPVGFTSRGLPVGLELLGLPFQDARLLGMAYPYAEANSPRQAPSSTPPLQSGLAPAPQRFDLSFAAQGAILEGEFEYDLPSNELRYNVRLGNESSAEVYAVTLMIDDEENAGLDEPLVYNLMGPDRTEASGSVFMSPAFRAAYDEDRVYLKVFASGMDVGGVAQRLK
jgi:Asp-tRNA(Asn)/Glu-tRNA(Gln) amidotransferase A subunit family amidase